MENSNDNDNTNGVSNTDSNNNDSIIGTWDIDGKTLSWYREYVKEKGLSEELEVINYIIKMGAVLVKPVMDIPLTIFGVPLPTGKAEINKIITEWEPDSNKLKIKNRISNNRKKLENLSKEWGEFEIKRVTNEYHNHINQMNNYLNNAMTYQMRAAESRNLLDQLTGTGAGRNIYGELVKLEELGHWNYVGLKGDLLVLLSEECRMTYYKPTAGIDMNIGLGRWYGVLHVRTGNFTCHPAFNVLAETGNGHKHPHIASSGSICWGTAASTANKYKVDREIIKVYELLWTLLNTYCPDNPYISLGACIEADRRYGRTEIVKNQFYDMLKGLEVDKPQQFPSQFRFGDIIHIENSYYAYLKTDEEGIHCIWIKHSLRDDSRMFSRRLLKGSEIERVSLYKKYNQVFDTAQGSYLAMYFAAVATVFSSIIEDITWNMFADFYNNGTSAEDDNRMMEEFTSYEACVETNEWFHDRGESYFYGDEEEYEEEEYEEEYEEEDS